MNSDEKYIFLKLSHFDDNDNNGPWYIKGFNKNNDFSGNTGMGNLLFQIACCLSLAWDNNSILYVPDINTWCNADNENIDKSKTIWRNVRTDIDDYKKKISKTISIRHGYHPNVFKFYNKAIYKGYLQSYMYFHKYKNKIVDFFGPDQNDLDYIYSKYSKYLNLNTCCLHVRRGKDFLKIAKKWNPEFLLKKSYYDKAISYFKDKVDIFLIFSDNLEYCRQTFNNTNYPNIKFQIIRERDYMDLWIMSLCNNYILSNSTFAWWGCYLNKNYNYEVIAPKKSVFLEKKKNKELEKVYYFKDWIIMDE